jgi:hypothetical protein
MEYTGKLYGRVDGKYFEMEINSEDWDNLQARNKYLEGELKKSNVDFKPELDDSRWIRYDDNAAKFKGAWENNIWVKHLDGTIIRYRDNAPVASLTHFIPK